MRISKLLICCLVFLGIVEVTANNGNPVELGKVNWIRNFEEGITASSKANKPVFLLFQEVPGCSTCRNYGQNVLSHPLIVEAIESLFVPVAIHNNKGGADAKVLKYFGEPSWNNPVVRIVNAEKENLVKRVNGNYTQLGIVQAMRTALQAEELTVPTYLSLLEEELIAEKMGVETATFSMYCFWTGEKEIGQLDGVVETQAGFMNGREVVSVKYNPAVIEYQNLLEASNKAQCASHVYTENDKQIKDTKKVLGEQGVSKTGHFRQDKDPKYYLGRTEYRYIPMTQLQAVKVNSQIGRGQSPNALLSPRQLEILTAVQANPKKKWKEMINEDFIKGWELVSKTIAK